MERKEIVLEFMKSIAPVFAQEGLNLQKRLIENGHDPSQCKVDGMDILHANAKGAREWADALADEYLKIPENTRKYLKD